MSPLFTLFTMPGCKRHPACPWDDGHQLTCPPIVDGGGDEEDRPLRCSGYGWIPLAVPDGRRGVWIRITSVAIELCAGREGDDEYLRLRLKETVTIDHLRAAKRIVEAFALAIAIQHDNVTGPLSRLGPRPDGDRDDDDDA